MDKEQITESTPTVCKFFRAAAVPILVFLVIYGFFLLSGLRLCPNTTGSMAPTIPAYSLCLIDTHVDYDSRSYIASSPCCRTVSSPRATPTR